MILVLRSLPESLVLAPAKEAAADEAVVAAVVVAGPNKVVSERETPQRLGRDKCACSHRPHRNPDDSKTFVPTSDYSRFNGDKRQAVFRCREEPRTNTQPPRGVSALAVSPPSPSPRGPPVFHVEHGAYTTMVAEMTQRCEDKCPWGPSDQPSDAMFGGRPGTI